jgi:hypothetical protein
MSDGTKSGDANGPLEHDLMATSFTAISRAVSRGLLAVIQQRHSGA